jgi:hypothetical protein
MAIDDIKIAGSCMNASYYLPQLFTVIVLFVFQMAKE